MNNIIRTLLEGKPDNHILPFFWQHGENEPVLRDYMRAIQESGCGAVCVESRPHPDFCGPKWWEDMDVILDEARKRNMKVWILDDSHFPTGYANGAVENAPAELCRQSICAHRVELGSETQIVTKELTGMIPPPFVPNLIESYVLPTKPKPRRFDDDSILHVSAFCTETRDNLDLSKFITDGVLEWEKPAGVWTLWVVGLSRNCGPHRNYINMLDRESCRLLIDAVYEPHWAHYSDDFGKTIAGFFSDEPELGNGHLYDMGNFLGTDQDLPFGRAMPVALEERLGANWASQMYLLWENGADSVLTAKVRYAFMDAVTRLVETSFSQQIGEWCRLHGVQYIGHIIEDAGAHTKTAASLGHYFRGLDGQDMSGIDDIGGQVYPQGENDNGPDQMGRPRSAEFYHFMLGRLASSAAAIEPRKQGRAMCEIFGNYGWAEGVQLEKYLADHFMVRGVNYYVPHAFSPKEFPDQDCPPHFYAHGHNPQFRHFGELMRYMNRVCTLTSAGPRVSEVAVLYHAEAEWTGRYMPGEKPGRVLEENQISFDFIPSDVFANPDKYNTKLEKTLKVNTQEYKALVIPTAQFVTKATALAVQTLCAEGFPVVFIDECPKGLCDSDSRAELNVGAVSTLASLVSNLSVHGIGQVKANPASTYLRVLHTLGESEFYYIVNEAADIYNGKVIVPTSGSCYVYDAWHNRLETIEAKPCNGGTLLTVTLEPRKSLIVVFGEPPAALNEPICEGSHEVALSAWTRATCESKAYPAFGEAVSVTLPDGLAEEQSEFSGYVRYETSFNIENNNNLCLIISDAAESVEVFVNGQSAGIQIVPPYRYDLTKLVQSGENRLVIDVATTLERKCYPLLEPMRKIRTPPPTALSGLTGTVKLTQR